MTNNKIIITADWKRESDVVGPEVKDEEIKFLSN